MEINDIKVIAKTVRAELKKRYPDAKFSITIERFAGGEAMNVALMSAPFQATMGGCGHEQLNQYILRRKESHQDYLENGRRFPDSMLTLEVWELMKGVDEIADRENWNNSDAMIDYFDVNYYLHLAIGKWNKDFVVS